ncbi:nucleoside/nucleotide kinase family protein [Nocardiopsis sp. CNR-923]|uniref:nucleoside/nucleotide kinase family protein n=1 Tax=Nocardiopsis sp. CNR-923 TaxID=1904965 RepID=UPI0009648FB9|nr:nucleoside/nucleotide kinase family protein [Nocardiopsis sp. CNR-923]OLT30646.1 nucleoside/nucleotide kinase family protein [Nocardiopsis sp. CNR-923]
MSDTAVTDALAIALAASRDGRRAVLGLAGAPAAGKSTLARRLVAEVDRRTAPGTAGYLPLDGFHLSDAQLDRLGRRDRKGAPDTFDAHGYVALVRRLLEEADHPVYVPDYDRGLHEPVAARHVVEPHTRLVVTEGNYLANDDDPWPRARALFTELWYVDAPDDVRELRLHRRQRAGGLTDAAAREWVERSDRPNGELVKRFRDRCTRVVRADVLDRR